MMDLLKVSFMYNVKMRCNLFTTQGKQSISHIVCVCLCLHACIYASNNLFVFTHVLRLICAYLESPKMACNTREAYQLSIKLGSALVCTQQRSKHVRFGSHIIQNKKNSPSGAWHREHVPRRCRHQCTQHRTSCNATERGQHEACQRPMTLQQRTPSLRPLSSCASVHPDALGMSVTQWIQKLSINQQCQ